MLHSFWLTIDSYSKYNILKHYWFYCPALVTNNNNKNPHQANWEEQYKQKYWRETHKWDLSEYVFKVLS